MHFPVTLYLYNVLEVVEVGKTGIRWEGREHRHLPGPHPMLPTQLQDKNFHFKWETSRWGARSSDHFLFLRKRCESREPGSCHGTRYSETPVGWRDDPKVEGLSWKDKPGIPTNM